MKIIFDEPTPPMSVEEKIAAVEEARQDGIDAEKDFRQLGMTSFAHDAALFIVACNEQLAELREFGRVSTRMVARPMAW
jgi:hypothetical protein